MKNTNFSSVARWPNVPACYGWLSLDRRGQWRMQGETVTHTGLASFLNRQYGHDADGNYFVQNGPQRVFVELEYTPWVLRLDAGSVLQTHTGETIEKILQAVFDEEGNLLLEFPEGIALLCDRDLPALLGCLYQADGKAADDDTLLNVLKLAPGTLSTLTLQWNGQHIPLGVEHRVNVARHYGFVSAPRE